MHEEDCLHATHLSFQGMRRISWHRQEDRGEEATAVGAWTHSDEALLGEHVLESFLHQLVRSAHQLQTVDVVELRFRQPPTNRRQHQREGKALTGLQAKGGGRGAFWTVHRRL